MIPKSKFYKLVRRSDKIVIAEGNKKDMSRLMKQTPGTVIYYSYSTKIGDKIE